MAILRCIVLLLVVAVAAHGSPHRGGGSKHSPELRACFDVLRPTGGRDAMKTMIDTCIAEQDGLQATIDSLKEAAGSERGGRKGRGRRGKHGGRGVNPMKLLEDAGNTAEAETLNKCIARENGYLTTDGTDAFDVEKFKTDLAAKGAGTDSESNIQLGIDNCSDEGLASFDIHTYMRCIAAYCATGEAPSTDAPPADDAEEIEP